MCGIVEGCLRFFCNYRNPWKYLWREGNFFPVPGSISSRYEFGCRKRRKNSFLPSYTFNLNRILDIWILYGFSRKTPLFPSFFNLIRILDIWILYGCLRRSEDAFLAIPIAPSLTTAKISRLIMHHIDGKWNIVYGSLRNFTVAYWIVFLSFCRLKLSVFTLPF